VFSRLSSMCGGLRLLSPAAVVLLVLVHGFLTCERWGEVVEERSVVLGGLWACESAVLVLCCVGREERDEGR